MDLGHNTLVEIVQDEKLPVPEGPSRNSLGVYSRIPNISLPRVHMTGPSGYGTSNRRYQGSDSWGIRMLFRPWSLAMTGHSSLPELGTEQQKYRDVEKRVSIARLRSNGMGIEAITLFQTFDGSSLQKQLDLLIRLIRRVNLLTGLLAFGE